MTDNAQLEAYLAEAEAARHQLIMGEKSVSVEYEGHKTTFQATSQAKLEAYIQKLKAQLGLAPRRRAPRVTF